MDPGAQLVLNLFIALVFGGITSAIAVSKGRNGVGWFFVGFFAGCIGLIIILCMSNLTEDQQRWSRAESERRRLREQLRQERLKHEAFQKHVRGRLDVHDEALGMDTRQLGEPEKLTPLEHGGPAPAAPAPAASVSDPASLRAGQWYAQIGDRRSEPLPFDRLRALYQARTINEKSLVWREGMADWTPILDVPGLLEELV